MRLPPVERARPVLVLMGVIWCVEAVNWMLGYRLNTFGIEPRSLGGLVGIVTAPLLHTGFGHAVSNSLPLLILEIGRAHV